MEASQATVARQPEWNRVQVQSRREGMAAELPSRAAGLRREDRERMTERERERKREREEGGWDEWKGRTGTRLVCFACMYLESVQGEVTRGRIISDGYLSI